MNTRYAIYARYSTEHQRRASTKDQIHDCRRHVKRAGGRVDADLVFVDDGASGATMNRPGLRKLLEAAEARRFDALVVEDVSRLSRDAADATAMLRLFRERRIRIVGVTDGVDTATPQGAAFFQLGAVIAEHQREAGRHKTRRGLAGRAREGFATGRLPYGYRGEPAVDEEGEHAGKRIVIDQRRAVIVRRIFMEYAAGKSAARIATVLNAERIPAPGAHRGRAWLDTTIRQMLRNESYIGRWSYARTEWCTDPMTSRRRPRLRAPEDVVHHEHPKLRIIDEALWTTTRERMAAVRACYAGTGKGAVSTGRFDNHLLSGLLRCAKCKSLMILHRGSRASYFICSKARKTGACANRIRLREDAAVDAVLEHVAHLLTSFAAQRYLESEVSKRLTNEPTSDVLALHKEVLDDVERKIAKLIAFVEGGDAGEAVRARLRELEGQRSAAMHAHEAERSRLLQQGRPATLPEVVGHSKDLRRVLAVDPVRAREGLRRLFRGAPLLVAAGGEGRAVLTGRLSRGTPVIITVSAPRRRRPVSEKLSPLPVC